MGSISIADHPTVAVQVAHAVRIDAATTRVERLSPSVAGDHVFFAAYSSRVPVAVEPAAVGNRNCQTRLPCPDWRERHRLCGTNRQDRYGREQTKREYFTHTLDQLLRSDTPARTATMISPSGPLSPVAHTRRRGHKRRTVARNSLPFAAEPTHLLENARRN